MGRGLQGVFWDYPLRTILWDESLFSPVVELLGMSWDTWVTSPTVDTYTRILTRLLGSFFLLCGGVVIRVGWRNHTLGKCILFLGSGGLVCLTILSTKDHFWQFGYFIEHALLMGAPFVLIARLNGTEWERLRYPLQLLTALTFIGHGLYASGYYPVPMHFLLMTLEGLGPFYGNFTGADLTEAASRTILWWAGLLDFITATLLVLAFKAKSHRSLIRLALVWMIPWAFLTTLARWWSNAGFSSTDVLLLYWTPQVLVRLVHILVPVILWKGTTYQEKPTD